MHGEVSLAESRGLRLNDVGWFWDWKFCVEDGIGDCVSGVRFSVRFSVRFVVQFHVDVIVK